MGFKPEMCDTCGKKFTEDNRSADIFLCKECKDEQFAEIEAAMAEVGNTPDERFEIRYRSGKGITKGKVCKLSLPTDLYSFDQCQESIATLEKEGHTIITAELRI